MATTNDYTVTVKTVFDKTQTKKDWNKLLKELQKEIEIKVQVDNASLKKCKNDLEAIKKITLSGYARSASLMNSAAKNFEKSMDKILRQAGSAQNSTISGTAPVQTIVVQNQSSSGSTSGSGSTAALEVSNELISDDDMKAKIIEISKYIATSVKEFNEIQTTLMATTKKSSEEVRKLMFSYMALGKELHVTGTEAAETASGWLELGKTAKETETLTKNSIILSKLSGLNASQSTEYLSQIMDGYQTPAENVTSILDKLSAVNASSPSDMGTLAKTLALTAENAHLAGISIDQLMGYIAAMGDSNEAGATLNSVFSRMNNMKSSRLESYQNSGEDLSNVEKTLSGEGISLRSANRSFKDTEEILEEVADKWASFSEVSQRSIAAAFAGSGNIENFIALMDNFAQTQEYAKDSTNSSGQAMQQYTGYTDSLKGKLQQFESAFQSLSNTILDSDLLKFFVDLGTMGVGAIESISKVLTSSGTLGVLAGGILSSKNIGQGKSRPAQYAYPC